MNEIRTAQERFSAYLSANGIPEKSSLLHIHKIQRFEDHERKELRAAYEALKAKVECLEGQIELEQAKFRGEEETIKRVVAHSEALKTENEELRHINLTSLADLHFKNRELESKNAAQTKRIAELENDLIEWNEFKKIRDTQMQALRKQMS